MSLYDRVLARQGGGRALTIARLKRAVLAAVHEAFDASGVESQSDLARRLHVRRSAVNQVFNGDGNLRVSTLAEYLYEMGYELDVTLVRSGEARAAALEGRSVQNAKAQGQSASSAVPISLSAAAMACAGTRSTTWTRSATTSSQILFYKTREHK